MPVCRVSPAPAPPPRPSAVRAGWSLAEMLVVIGIIALVMGLILGTFIKVYRILESW